MALTIFIPILWALVSFGVAPLVGKVLRRLERRARAEAARTEAEAPAKVPAEKPYLS